MSELAAMIEEDLRRAYEEADFEQLPTFIFEEAEQELTKMLFSEGEEQTDGAALNLIISIVEKIRRQIDKESLCEKLKIFLITLTKIFTLLLNIKVDTADKIIKIIQLLNSAIAKKWLEQR